VCRAWDELASSDAIWKPLYIKRFHFLDPKEAVGMRRFKHLFKVSGPSECCSLVEATGVRRWVG
jgi:hypothetical protein